MSPVVPLSVSVKVTPFIPPLFIVVVVLSVGAGVAVYSWVGDVAAGWVHLLTSSTSASVIERPMIPGRNPPERRNDDVMITHSDQISLYRPGFEKNCTHG